MMKLLTTGALILAVSSAFAGDAVNQQVRTTCYNTDSNDAIPYSIRYNSFLDKVEFQQTKENDFKECKARPYAKGPSMAENAFENFSGPEIWLGTTDYLCETEKGYFYFVRYKEKTVAIGIKWVQLFTDFSFTLKNNKTIYDSHNSEHKEKLIVAANADPIVQVIDSGSLTCPDAKQDLLRIYREEQ